jgi:hypothetical protein
VAVAARRIGTVTKAATSKRVASSLAIVVLYSINAWPMPRLLQHQSSKEDIFECVSIALAGSKAIYVVCEDNTLGNHQILFSRDNALLSDV